MRVTEDLVDKIQENISYKWEVTKSATTVTTDLIEQHLIDLLHLHSLDLQCRRKHWQIGKEEIRGRFTRRRMMPQKEKED